MAYQVTFVNTKNNAADPELPEWVNTLSDDYLDSLYPELNGQTPNEILSVVPTSMDPADGFISTTNTKSDDGTVRTLVELWDSQASFDEFQTKVKPLFDANCNVGTISCSTTSTTVTGSGTNFTHLLYNDSLVTDEGDLIGNVASVTNDTSLTLQSNSILDLTDSATWDVNHKLLAIDYLYDQYPYTVTTEITTANV